jgi:hypothetical protein
MRRHDLKIGSRENDRCRGADRAARRAGAWRISRVAGALCHTPRRFDASTDDTKFLAGGLTGQPGGQHHAAQRDGIGRWAEAQSRGSWAGVKPSGHEAYS